MNKAYLPLSRKTTLIAVAGVFVIALIAFAIWKYSQAKSVNADNTAFAKYIEGYTTGVISREGTVRVRLASQVSTFQQTNEEESRKLFTIQPSVKGKAYWTDARTIEFRPDEQLKPGQTYHVGFDLGQVTDVSADLKTFAFNFKVIEPSYSVEVDGLKAQTNNSLDRMKLTGNVLLADAEQPENIEKILTASHAGKSLGIKWQHNIESRTSTFTIDSIQRWKQAGKLALQWDGAPIASKKIDKKELEVPQTGSFKVLDIRAVHEPEQYVLVQFSDPVLVAQHLDGLIGISETTNLRYTIDGSEVKVYAPDRLEGSYSIAVNEGVENIDSQKITAAYSANVNFDNSLPSVSITAKGTILPGSGQRTMP